MVALRKIKHGVLFLLSAILLSCAVLACTQIFFNKEGEPQNQIYAEAAISGSGTSASPYVISGTTAEMATGWTTAINASVSGKKQVYVTLGANWTAVSDSTYAMSFGSDTQAFYLGMIRIPTGADIVLNLNGKTISRGLTAARNEGCVIGINGTLEIKGTGTITGGNNSGYGGAIRVFGGKLTLSGGTVKGNKAAHGGGISIESNGSVTIAGGTVTENTVDTGSGIAGGIYVIGSGNALTMTSGTISKNAAQKGGGVGLIAGATFNMSGGTIDGNKYSSQGGGVWLWHNNTMTTFNMTGGTISNNVPVANTSPMGGGIWGGGMFKIKMTNGNITGNESVDGGGGIMCWHSDEMGDAIPCEVSGGKISGNKGGGSSGGIGFFSSVRNSQLKISNTVEISNNTADIGAGIYVEGWKATLNMSGGTISKNTAQKGGGVACNGGVTFNMSGGTIDGNKYSAQAGGVWLYSTNVITKFVMSGGKISNNTPNVTSGYCSGGGMWAGGNIEVEMTAGTISGNTALTDAGGIFCSSKFNLYGGTITGNKGPTGGIIFDENTQVNIKGNPNVSGNFLANGTTKSNINRNGVILNVVGALTSTSATIGIYNDGQITCDYKTHNSSKNPNSVFVSDISGKEVKLVGNEAVIVTSGTDTSKMVAQPRTVGTLYYDGTSQILIEGYNSTYMNAPTSITSGASLSGTNIVATNAGTFSATFSLKSGYKWTDGTTASKTLSATISKVAATTSGFASKTVTYNGSAQSIAAPTATPGTGVTWKVTYKQGETTVASPTNAGTYTATATPTFTANYSSVPTCTATLTINKADLTVTLAYSTAPTYGGSAVSPTLTVKRGTTTITSGYGTVKYSIASGDQNSTAYPGKATINATSGALTGTKAGKIRVTVSIAASGNYNAASATKEVTVGQKDIKTNGSVADIAAVTYSRAEHKPTPAVTNTSKNAAGNSTTLTKDTDYTLSYTNNIKAGTATVTVTGKGNYKGTMTKTFTINKKALMANSTAANKVFDGNTTATVTAGTLSGTVSGDTVTFTAAGTFADKNVGNSKNVTIKYTLAGADAGNYSMANKTVTANITAKSIATDGALNITGAYIYTGAPLTPTYTVTNSAKNAAGNSTTLTKDTDYTVSITNNTNAGTATVTVTGKGNYNSSISKDFTISKAQITAVEWDGKAAGAEISYEYDGTAKQPKITKVTTGNTLANGALPADLGDMFTFAGAATNKRDAAYEASATLKTDYAKNFEFSSSLASGGDKSKTARSFKITATQLALVAGASAAAVVYSGTYDRKRHPAFTALNLKTKTTADAASLTWHYSLTNNGTDWTTVMPEFVDATAGTRVYYKVTADNHADYTGSANVVINKKDISGAGSTLPESLADVYYTGSKIETKSDLTVRVTFGTDGYVLNNDTVEEYALTFANSLNAGTATITVNGRGNYEGSKSITFKILLVDLVGVTANGYGGAGGAIYDGANHDAVAGKAASCIPAAQASDTASIKWEYSLVGGAGATDWTEDMPQVKNVADSGTYYYRVSANNHVTKYGSVTVLITAKTLSAATATVEAVGDKTYTGSPIEPTPAVTDSDLNAVLTSGTDYDVSYSADHTSVGAVTITFTGKGNYAGNTLTATFNIVNAGITVDKTALAGYVYNAVYDGQEHDVLNAGYGACASAAGTDTLVWQFSLDGTSFAGSLKLKDATAGTTVYYKVSADNHSDATGSFTVVINKLKITEITGVTAESKTYDGGNSAKIDYSGAQFKELCGADDLKIASATGTFASKNAGSWTVTISDITLSGAQVGNYELALNGGDNEKPANAFDLAGSVEIKKLAVSIKLSWTQQQYTGARLVPDAVIENKVEGDSLGVTAAVKDSKNPVNPGTYVLVISALTNNNPENYSFANAPLELTFEIITSNKAVQVNMGSLKKTYDGKPAEPYLDARTVNESTGAVTWERLGTGDLTYTYEITPPAGVELVDGKPVNAGTYKVTFTINTFSLSWQDVSISGATLVQDLVIEKATFGDITWQGGENVVQTAENAFEATYNGGNFAITIANTLPEGITVVYLYDGVAANGKTAANEKGYAVTAKFTVDGNYNAIEDKTATLIIKRAELDLTDAVFADGVTTFDGTVKTIAAARDLPEGVTVTSYEYLQGGESLGTDGVRAVGDYVVRAKLAYDDVNYKLVKSGADYPYDYLEANFTVDKQGAELNVEFNGATVTYDGNVHRLLISGTANGVKSVSYTYVNKNTGASAGTDGVKNAGTYTVTAHFEIDGENFSGTIEDMVAELVINPAPLTLRANDSAIYYGDARTFNGAEMLGLVSGDGAASVGTVTFNTTYTQYANAGTYDIVPEITNANRGESFGNYAITYENGTLTVKPRVITVKWYNTPSMGAQDLSYIYSGSVNTPYAVVDNPVLGDSGLKLNVVGGQTDAGFGYVAKVERYVEGGVETDYAVYNADGGINKNYVLPANGASASFDILPRPKNGVIIWDNEPLYYDGTEKAPKAYYYENESDNTPRELSVTVDRRAVNAGTGYVATASLGGNYALTGPQTRTFDILKREVFIEIPNLTVAYGVTPDLSGLEWKYLDGSLHFADGEVYEITFTTDAVTEPKNYPIRGNFSCVNAGNYEVKFVGAYADENDAENSGKCGILTVTAGNIDVSKVTFIGTEATYDKTAHKITASGLPQGVTAKYEYTQDGWSFGENGVVDAGTYNVIVSFECEDKAFGAIADREVTLVIKKAALTVTAKSLEITFGDAPKTNGIEYSIKDEDLERQLSGTLSLVTDYVRYGAAGGYIITASGLTSENYEISFVPGTLTVNPREVTVSWYTDETATSSDFSYTYVAGNSYLPYAVITGGLVNGDNLTVVVDGAATEAGLGYVATVKELKNADGTVNGNYKVTNDTQSFNVLPQAYTVVWDNSPLYYTGADLKPSAYYFAEGDDAPVKIPEGNVTVTPVDGKYSEAGVKYTASVNYTVDGHALTDTHEYEIQRADVTVIITAQTAGYGARLGEIVLSADKSIEGVTLFVKGYPDTNAVLNAGEYVIGGEYSGSNYNVTFTEAKLTITPAEIDESKLSLVGDRNVKYDGKAHTLLLDYNGSTTDLPEGITVTYKYYGADGREIPASEVINAGTYAVEAVITVDKNHKPLTGTYKDNIVIGATEITGITFNGAMFDYDGNAHNIFISAKDTEGIESVEYLVDGKPFAGATDAGVYSVTAKITAGANYTLAKTEYEATLNINRVSLTVKANDGSTVYGTPAKAEGYGYTVSGAASVDNNAAKLAGILGSITYNYGAYGEVKVYGGAITISGGNAQTTNYNITYLAGALTVTPFVVKAENVSWGAEKNFGYIQGTSQAPEATPLNLPDSGLKLKVEGAKEEAGSNYTAYISAVLNADGTVNGNYVIDVSGVETYFSVLPVTPKAGKVVWDNTKLYYNGEEQRPEAWYYETEDSAEGTPLTVTGGATNVNESGYTASVTLNGKTYTTTFYIIPRTVYVEISDVKSEYGAAPNMSAVSWKYVYADKDKQFLAGEQFSFTFTTSATATSGVGKYALLGKFSSPNEDNYEVIFTGSWASADENNGRSATLEVVKATYDMSKVTFTGTDVTYDGQPHKIKINGLPDGVTATVTYEKDGFGYTQDAGVINAGRYTVIITYAGDINHEPIAGVTTTLTVRKAAVTVTAEEVEITYGEMPRAAGVTVEPAAAGAQLKGGVTYEFNYSYKGAAGEYLITPSGLTSENYEITFVPAKLTVKPRMLEISWFDDERMNSQSFKYGWDNRTVYRPYAYAGGLVEGDAVALELSQGFKDAGENYVVKVLSINNSDGGKNGNYVLPTDGSAERTFDILPPEYTVIWDNTPIYYKPDTPQVPKAYYIDAAGVRHDMDVTTSRTPVDATNYVATATVKDGDINNVMPSAREFVILPAPVTVTVNPANAVYGVAAGEIKFTSNASAEVAKDLNIFVNGYEATDVLKAGKYEITATYTGVNAYMNPNYEVTVLSGELVIEKADYDLSNVTYNGLTAVYDGAAHRVTVDGLPEGVTAVVTYEKDGVYYGADGVRAAGAYNVRISFTIADGANFNAIADKTDLQLVISKKAASASGFTFAGETLTYDGNMHSLYVSGGTLEGVKEITYAYNGEQVDGVKNSGTYEVKATFVIDEENYSGSIEAATATLVINKAALTVTANGGSAVYGDTLPADGFGYTLSGLAATDGEEAVLGTVTVGYSAVNPATEYKNAGVYAGALTVTYTNSAFDNYEVNTVAGTLLITPKTLSASWRRGENDYSTVFEYIVTAGEKFIPYAAVIGSVNGDDIVFEVVEEKDGAGDNYVATIIGVKNADGTENKNYALPAGGLTQKFTVKYSTEEEKEHAYEVVWDYNTPYYDGNAHTPSAKYFDGSVWQAVTGIVVKNAAGATVTAVNAGRYTAEITGDTSKFTQNSVLAASFEILARPVHVEINDKKISYGERFVPDESLWSIKDESLGFVNGDEAYLAFTVSGSAVGKYAVIGAYTGANAANYAVTFTGNWAADGDENSGKCGVLEIIKAVYDVSKVTITDTVLEYNGGDREVKVNGVPEGLEFTVTYMLDGRGYSAARNAGVYGVLVTFAGDSNHEPVVPKTATLTVTRAKLTVTANESVIVYGDEPRANGVSFAGLKGDNADDAGVFAGALTYSYNYEAGNPAGGNYKITPSGLTSANYEITFKDGVLTVEKRPVTVNWFKDASKTSTALSYVYDGLTTFAPFAEASGVLAGDTVNLTVSGGKTAAGIDYTATVTGVSNPNYRLPDGGATAKFSIIPQSYEIVWESTTFVYNGERQAPRAYYFDADGARRELAVTVEGVTDGASVRVGDYKAVALKPADSDVKLSGSFEHEFTIEKLAVTVKINDAHSYYRQGIKLGGWECINGTAFVGGSAPVILECAATETSPAGTYAITGRCTDAVNYYVDFEYGVYTVDKAVVEAPAIASKEYTGERLTADIADTAEYRVYANNGGINAGGYDVILELKDYENYRWIIGGEEIRSANCTVTFNILKAKNEFTTEFEPREIKAGESIEITEPVAKFGAAVVEYFKDADCTQAANTAGNIWNEPQGVYYARVTVEGTENYEGLGGAEYIYVFAVNGKLTLKLNWSDEELYYNGTPQAPKAYVWLNGKAVELLVVGAQTNAGKGYTAVASLNAADGVTDLTAYAFSTGEGSQSATVTFSILPREITVNIEEDRQSVYGDLPFDVTRLNYTITAGSVLAGDRLGISFYCNALAGANTPAGKYAILGRWTDGNYNVTFTGSWDEEDEYKGAAATYVVEKAEITVGKNGTEWFDESGLIEKHKSHFVTLGNEIKNAEGEVTGYQFVNLKGKPENVSVDFSLTLDNYDPEIHDGMTEADVERFFDRGVRKDPPEIKQAGNWVVYYRITADNHNVKYGQWKVLIQSADNYIIVEFVKDYTAEYGNTVAGANIINELIDNGIIRLADKNVMVTDMEQLRSIATAYAYADVSSAAGFAGKTTAAGAYTVLLSLKPDAWVQEAYGDLTFIYKPSSDEPDSNIGRYVITPRKVGVSWGDKNFVYDGTAHTPSFKLTGLVDGKELEVSVNVGETKAITLPNGDVIEATLSLISGSGVVNAGSSTLRLTVNGANYELETDSAGFAEVNVAKSELDIEWGEKTFDHDGEVHLPALKINGKEFAYTLTNGVATVAVEMPNGETVNVTVRLVGGSTVNAGTYTLQLEVDNGNYAVPSSQGIASVEIKGEPVSGVELPLWAIIAISAGGALLLIISITVIAKRKKKSPAVGGSYSDEDGFNDDYEE